MWFQMILTFFVFYCILNVFNLTSINTFSSKQFKVILQQRKKPTKVPLQNSYVLPPFTLKILFVLTLSVCHSNATSMSHIKIVWP